MSITAPTKKEIVIAILVASLGYFVDVYDLILFSVVRVSSLRDLAIPEDQLLSVGVYLLNMQLAGMLLGGFLWGILADKRGRMKVLLGSIALYSIANILNGFVTSIPQYAFCRFIAGIGLAGELGAGVTLICEMLPKQSRTLGTTIISTMGMLGGTMAALFGDKLPWHASYILGGALGIVLLMMRLRVRESPMFKTQAPANMRLGDLRLLVESPKRLLRYIACTLIGTPIWFILAVVATFAPEISEALNVQEPVSAGNFLLFSYIGSLAGNGIASWSGHYFQSHKKSIIYFLIYFLAILTAFLLSSGVSSTVIYAFACAIGIVKGYWPLTLANAAEQFGTNLRATVTTTISNVVRACAIPLTLSFAALKEEVGVVSAAWLVGFVSIAIAFISALSLKNSYSEDLDFLEE